MPELYLYSKSTEIKVLDSTALHSCIHFKTVILSNNFSQRIQPSGDIDGWLSCGPCCRSWNDREINLPSGVSCCGVPGSCRSLGQLWHAWLATCICTGCTSWDFDVLLLELVSKKRVLSGYRCSFLSPDLGTSAERPGKKLE